MEHLLFHVVADRYIRYILKPRDNNQDREINYMEQWKGYFSNKLITDIQKKDVAEAKDKMFEDKTGNSRGTGKVAVNRAMARLKHFFNVCEDDWGIVTHNPAKKIKPFKESSGKLDYLEAAQIVKLLSEASKSRNKDMELFTLMILTTGGRKSEIANVYLEDIYFDEKKIKLRRQKNGQHGELYLNDDVIELIKKKRRTAGRLFKSKYMDKGFKMAARRAGVEHITIHGLRHTFASHVAMGGASTQEVQAALRVSSPNMVQRYSHLTSKHIRDKVTNITNQWSKNHD